MKTTQFSLEVSEVSVGGAGENMIDFRSKIIPFCVYSLASLEYKEKLYNEADLSSLLPSTLL